MASGAAGSYDRELGLDTSEMYAFIGATQPDPWHRLLAMYGTDTDEAMRQFARRVAQEIDARGALDVLRHGVRDRGHLIGSRTSGPPTRSPTTRSSSTSRTGFP